MFDTIVNKVIDKLANAVIHKLVANNAFIDGLQSKVVTTDVLRVHDIISYHGNTITTENINGVTVLVLKREK